MKATSKSLSHTDLHELFVDELRDILWAENQLTKALPKLAKAARSDELRLAFSKHLAETIDHVDRLDTVFEKLGLAPRAMKCEAMEGLLKEGEDLMAAYSDSPGLDAALIAAAQKVEHYEIATYGTLRAYAKRLGHTEIEDLLARTLGEECDADVILTGIAEGVANEVAVQPA